MNASKVIGVWESKSQGYRVYLHSDGTTSIERLDGRSIMKHDEQYIAGLMLGSWNFKDVSGE